MGGGLAEIVGVLSWGAGAFACLIAACLLSGRPGLFAEARRALTLAVTATGLWALAGTLTGPLSLWTELADSLRNLVWLFALYRLFAVDGRHATLAPVRPLLVTLALVELMQVAIQLFMSVSALGAGFIGLAFHTVTLFRLLVVTGGLVLAHNLYSGAAADTRLSLRWPALALAAQWGFDLNHYTVSYLLGWAPGMLAALRGVVALAVGLLLAMALRRRNGTVRFSPSRAVMFQSASLMIIGGYLVFMVVTARWLVWAGQELTAEWQLAFVSSAAVLLAVLTSSRRVRGWLRVTLAKHLFQHRYDYREEWLRFTRTIGRGHDGGALQDRVIRAVADMTGSPGGLLLLADEQGDLALASRWQWPTAEVPSIAITAEAVRHFEADRSGGFIVDLDELRAPAIPASTDWQPPQRAVPAWLLAEPRAWAMVPLHHFERVVGMVVLARPAVARRLDWEDFDLLRVAGQQLASYLAEQAGQEALAEAARFDDFNRRIAFVMHDIKNLASQLGLLARNAEAHAENPDFRADMLVTLRNAADRLNALLARLSRYGTSPVESLAPLSASAVARRVLAQLQAGHPLELAVDADSLVLGRDDLVEQVLIHLVQNAIDASTPDQRVTLRLAQEGSHGMIAVEDRGTGMSAEFIRTSLFKPFVSTKPGGFGIGAYEARELVRAMGGRLDVASREGLGSRFTIRLPLAAEPANLAAKVA